MSVIVNNLTKIYGTQKAVDNLSFEAKEGEILGFLGPNGAGKSTTMKIATCFLPQSSGDLRVCGFDTQTQSLEVRKCIGYLPEHNPLYLDMYVHESLQFTGSLYGLRGNKLKQRVAEMVDLCGLGKEQNKKIEELSKGFRQRVGIAQAILHDPKVLILDEPTTGLDPNQLVEIREVIRSISKNKTVIFSTHIMQEVQALCDRVLVINHGKIVADDTIDGLKGGGGQYILLSVEVDKTVPSSVFDGIEGVLEVEGNGHNQWKLKIENGLDKRAEVSKALVQANAAILEMKQEEKTMEDVFQLLTKQQP